jgi:Carboxypeptidase regulatory-like domain
MKNLIIIAAVLFSSGQLFAQIALGEVLGEVVDQKEQGIYGAHVYIDDNGSRYQAKTDPEGRFRISAVPSGEYLLIIRQGEDTMAQRIPVNVPMDGFDNLGVIPFVSSFLHKDAVVVTYVRDGIRLVDGNLPIKTLSSEEIMRSPVKFDVKQLVTSMSSDVRQTEDGELVFRGARKGDMIYMIDGVKTRDAGSVPSLSIGRMQLYTGGLPAKYGDTLGGVVVMESKSYFDLYRSWYAAQLKAGKTD